MAYNVNPQAVAASLSLKPFALLPAGQTAIACLEAGKCGFCGSTVEVVRDAGSLREFNISGMCQPCQDATFGK
jgi:hypothetical protein